MNDYITIALTKGRLADQTMKLLGEAGYYCEELKDKSSRKLIFVNEEQKLRFFLAKGPDVPTYVEYGAADIGIVGKDTLLEENRNLYEMVDLEFGACNMCVCGRPELNGRLSEITDLKVASKYPNIARQYFQDENLLFCLTFVKARLNSAESRGW